MNRKEEGEGGGILFEVKTRDHTRQKQRWRLHTLALLIGKASQRSWPLAEGGFSNLVLRSDSQEMSLPYWRTRSKEVHDEFGQRTRRIVSGKETRGEKR
jgi:hypothetical protein